MKFSDNLRINRDWKKYTQEELASRCGLTGSAISHFETGKREPSLKNIIKLCKGLRCKPNDLIDI